MLFPLLTLCLWLSELPVSLKCTCKETAKWSLRARLRNSVPTLVLTTCAALDRSHNLSGLQSFCKPSWNKATGSLTRGPETDQGPVSGLGNVCWQRPQHRHKALHRWEVLWLDFTCCHKSLLLTFSSSFLFFFKIQDLEFGQSRTESQEAHLNSVLTILSSAQTWQKCLLPAHLFIDVCS